MDRVGERRTMIEEFVEDRRDRCGSGLAIHDDGGGALGGPVLGHSAGWKDRLPPICHEEDVMDTEHGCPRAGREV